jgi:CRISPR system Cascade subunit CasE
MFITRLRLNTGRPSAQRMLSSPRVLHATLMGAFRETPQGTGAASDTARVLWRVDRWNEAYAVLNVVSACEPDLTRFVEQAGWPSSTQPGTPGWETLPYHPLLDHLAEGDVWDFKLTANPVHCVRRGEGEAFKRVAHSTARHQRKWLLDRQEQSGFQVLEAEAPRQARGTAEVHHSSATDRCRPLGVHGTRHQLRVSGGRELTFPGKTHATDGRTQTISLVTVTFEGRLQVSDPVALRHALTRGIGKAKAYGCGLMTLRRPSRHSSYAGAGKPPPQEARGAARS